MKLLSQLLPHLKHLSLDGADVQVAAITYDSRKVSNQSLYVARRGQKSDGHDFIERAILSGATVIVCEYFPAQLRRENQVSIVLVENSAIALAELAHAFYDFPSQQLRMIGITGTNGKTTCATVLKQIFEAQGEIVGMLGTTGNFIADQKLESHFTTPEAPELCALLRRMIDEGVTTVVMEVSSHGLALRRVHGISFDVALFTNLTQDHLDFHETMSDYALAKKILFDSLDTSALAIVNIDDVSANTLLKDCKARVVCVGYDTATTALKPCLRSYTISQTVLSSADSTCLLNQYSMRTSLVGGFNIENAALCAATALELGCSAKSVLSTIAATTGAPGRMQRIAMPNGATAIVDYAHTPDALQKALHTSRQILVEGSRLICVFGCGGDRDKSKRPLMGAIAVSDADLVIVTNDNPRNENPQRIADDILEGMNSRDRVQVIPDRRAAIAAAYSASVKGDIILVAGKGHEEYQIIGEARLPFSDVQELISLS